MLEEDNKSLHAKLQAKDEEISGLKDQPASKEVEDVITTENKTKTCAFFLYKIGS